LGDYDLKEQIAHGGMGVVYRAYQASLDRTVAVKLLLLGRYSSPDSVLRFHREAQSAAALRHPHIVSVFEVGECDGQPFLAMEYVEGRSLAELLRQGPLPPQRAARYARTVAEAIAYAHSRGVLHRDVKPSNVLLDVFDQIRLTDFGLAKKLDGSGDLTLTGEMLGSPNYLSPEQAEGRHGQIGPPSDIYGIGALLYELLTGRPPFLAASLPETLLRIRDSEPLPPSSLNPAIPRDLDTITLKCLEKAPDRRYASADALAEDLHRFLRHEPIAARPVSGLERTLKWIRRNRATTALLATAAFSLVAFAVGSLAFSFHVQRARAETEAANRRLARDLFVREWSDAEQLLEDGKTVPALTWFARTVRSDPSNAVAASRLLSLLGDVTLSIPFSEPLIHTNAVLGADFSKDGRYLLTASADDRVRIWDWRSGGDPVVLPRTFRSPAANWETESGRVLVADHAGVSLWTTEGTLIREVPGAHSGSLHWKMTRDRSLAMLVSSGEPPQLWDPRQLLRIESPALQEPTLRMVGFGGHGRYLFRSRIETNPQRWMLGLHDIRTGRIVWEAEPGQDPRSTYVYSAEFSDDETLVACCRWGGQTLVYRIPRIDSETSLPVAGGEPIFRWNFGEVTRVEAFRFLDENRRLLVATSEGMVQQFDLTTGQSLPDRVEHSGKVHSAVVSPDGTTLATASVDGWVRFWDLRVRRPEPWKIQRSNVVWDVAFSPDARWLAVAGYPAAALYDARTGARHHELPMEGLVSRVAFSLDSQRLATSTEPGMLRVWDVATGAPVTDTIKSAGPIHDLWYSPDGRRLVVGAPTDQVRLLDSETAQPVEPLPKAGATLVMSVMTPDQRRLISGTVHGEVHFWSLPEVKPLSPSARHRSVVWATRLSRDGRWLATASGDQTVLIWETETARVIREFRCEKAAYGAEFSPDGRRVLIGSADRTARIREIESGRQVSETMRHPGGVWHVQFSPDGRLVATGDDAGYARLWDTATGLPLGNWLRSRDTLKRIAFSPDGRQLATASSDRTVRVWPVVVAPSPSPHWVPDLAEAIAGRRLDSDNNLHSIPFETWRAARDRFTPSQDPGTDFYDRWARWFFVERLAAEPVPFVGSP
jgi:serine/threonine protein kinase/WD40 repeat protein